MLVKGATVRCLTHWGRVTHICVGDPTIIGLDNGLSPGRRQAIIWINAGILLIRPLGTNFNEMLIEILTFSFMKIRLKVSSAKWRPFCLGLNVLIPYLNHWWLIRSWIWVKKKSVWLESKRTNFEYRYEFENGHFVQAQCLKGGCDNMILLPIILRHQNFFW